MNQLKTSIIIFINIVTLSKLYPCYCCDVGKSEDSNSEISNIKSPFYKNNKSKKNLINNIIKPNEIENYNTAIDRYLDKNYCDEKLIFGIRKGGNTSNTFLNSYIKDVFCGSGKVINSEYNEFSLDKQYHKGVITFDNIKSGFEIEIKFYDKLMIEFQAEKPNNIYKKAHISLRYKVTNCFKNQNCITLNLNKYHPEYIRNDLRESNPKGRCYISVKDDINEYMFLLDAIKKDIFEAFSSKYFVDKIVNIKIIEIKIDGIEQNGTKINENRYKDNDIILLRKNTQEGIIKLFKNNEDIKRLLLKIYANLLVERILTEYKLDGLFYDYKLRNSKNFIDKNGNINHNPSINDTDIKDIKLKNIDIIFEK